jgi:hypothetical protein
MAEVLGFSKEGDTPSVTLRVASNEEALLILQSLRNPPQAPKEALVPPPPPVVPSVVKKTRQPWSEEARQAARERMLRRHGKADKPAYPPTMINRDRDEEYMRRARQELGSNRPRAEDDDDS